MAITRTGYVNYAAFPVTGAANVIYVDLSNGNEYTWSGTAYVAYTGTAAGVRTANKDYVWFASNPTILLGKGQRVDLDQTGLCKVGDGITQLKDLSFLPTISTYTPLNKAGDTMTGSLILNANATNDLGAVTLQQLNETVLNTVPQSMWYGSVAQFFDGTIIGNEFIDKSGKGLHLDIINNDITIKGFPYKSGAMVAQKASTFGLIPNPNLFWFTAGGTPNQIPVNSFFQNVDYADQIFTKHTAQLLDANGVELVEPKITEIVTYSTALTGNNLTNANTYFGVPAEVTTNVYWVDWVNGLDTNAGTKLLPFKTLAKANTGTANKTIYVKTGTYADTASLYLLGGQIWNFIGYCPCTNTATPAFAVSATNSNYIHGAIITPPSGGRALYFISGNNNTAYRCKLNVNGASSKNFQILAGTGNVLKYSVLQNSQNTPAVDLRAVGMDIYGCHFSGSSSENIISCNTTAISGNVNIIYNKFINTVSATKTLFLFNVAGTYNIKYNVVNINGGTGLQTLLAGATMTGSINYNYNTIKPTNTTYGIIVSIDPLNVINYNISNNYILIDVSNSPVNSIIALVGQPPPIINNNYIDNYTIYNIMQFFATSVKGAADVSYNTLLSRIDGAGHIVIGSDASGAYDNAYNGTTVIGNKLYGVWYFNPASATNLSHGIAIFNCINCKVKYNYVNGVNHLVVIKASDRVTAMVNTDCVVSYNVGINNEGSLFPKTMSGIKFLNNTTYSDNPNIVNISGGIYLLGSTGPAINNTFKNNIFIDKTPVNSNISIVRVEPATSLSGLVSNNNIFYSLNNSVAKVITPGVNTYVTLAQWKALGYDADSSSFDVDFESISLEKFYSKIPIGNSEILASTYEDGLDISTNWPTVITKKQGVKWQFGAYVK
jgi:hypothetical protein